MIADVVRSLGGDLVNVEGLIGPGVDPHLYKPIRDDVVAILNADIVFYNGLLLEGRMAELFERVKPSQQRIVAMADAIPETSFLGEPGTDAIDPHIWMDVSMWKQTVDLVLVHLAELSPGKKQALEARADALRKRLTDLDNRGRVAIQSIPAQQRVLITSHDAFQYFGRRYGLQVEGIQGMSTASEAGLQRIPQLLDLVVSRSIPSVFRESSVAGKLMDALIEGAHARGHPLRVGAELYSDALGPTGSGADSYIGMMEHNFREIATALGGTW
jgi:manganese/zinc/iron transport system substrate-binding protein